MSPLLGFAKIPRRDHDRGRIESFDNTPSWPTAPVSLYAEVVFNRPIRAVYSYAVPLSLSDRILAGKRVLVPFGKGNKQEVGYCVGLTDRRPETTNLKAIDSVLDDQPLLSTSMLRLTRWIADYYFSGWGQVLEAVLPRAVKEQSGTRWVILLSAITRANAHPESLSPKQRQAYELLLEAGKPLPMEEATRLARVGPGVIKGLIQKGWASASRQRLQRWVEGPTNVTRTKSLVLNKHQQEACDRIVRAIETGDVHSLFASWRHGKRKDRSLSSIDRRGRQTWSRSNRSRAGNQPDTTNHRAISGTIQRNRCLAQSSLRFRTAWILAANSKGRGTRRRRCPQRNLAPCRNLGLVIIDEEHETTFKQETTPRYHARTVAFERSRLESVPVVLGSATPSLESWMAAHRGECELLSLPERVGELTMPRVRCIDLREEYRRQRGLASISPSLAKAMLECLERKGQVILLLNRRGFAPAIICPQCGQTAKCHHCDIALTFHKHRGQAVCHSCDATCPAPRQCSHCGHNELKLTGFGTQRLQDEVESGFQCSLRTNG